MLGQALVATKGYGAAEPAETYARARELCEQLNRPAQLGQVIWGQWVFCHVRAELEQAEGFSNAMRQHADTQNDAMWKCFASAYSADTCSYLGKFREARTYSEKALPLWNASYRAFAPAAGDPYVVSLISLSRALLRGITGETPNLAARLQAIAEPNTVVIGEATRKLVGNLFELQDLGAKDVKGIGRPGTCLRRAAGKFGGKPL